jgi:hypothetical protein
MAELRPLTWERAGGRCDMCGLPLPEIWECHHRRLKSQGGKNELPNLLALDYRCHAYAHEHRTWARIRGYIVHRPDMPALRPVLRHQRTWELPTDTEWIPSTPPDDYETTEERTAAA